MLASAIPHIQNINVAVVDDDETVRWPVVTMLKDSGANVLEFSSASQALHALGAATTPAVDIVLTDVNMPGIDGVLFAESLWARFPLLPVVFMSGQAPPANAEFFIAKPFGKDTLFRMLATALGSSPDCSSTECSNTERGAHGHHSGVSAEPQPSL